MVLRPGSRDFRLLFFFTGEAAMDDLLLSVSVVWVDMVSEASSAFSASELCGES